MRMPLLVNLPLRDYISGAVAPMSRILFRTRRILARSQGPVSSVTCPSLALEQKMSAFDYDAAAELFPSRRKFRTTRATYMRFATAAEAIRHAVEVLPERAFLGTILEV